MGTRVMPLNGLTVIFAISPLQHFDSLQLSNLVKVFLQYAATYVYINVLILQLCVIEDDNTNARVHDKS